MCSRLFFGVGVLLGLAIQGRGAVVEQFGLDHTPIGGAAITNRDNDLVVNGVDTSGNDGVSTELGMATFGAFFFPDTYYPDGRNMNGAAYGSVNGVADQRVSYVYGERVAYGVYVGTADFSSLGANSVTYQVWRGDQLLSEVTSTNGTLITVYSDYALPPRVNPWWQQRNGDWGASVEFFGGSLGLIVVPNDVVLATRLFMRPNGVTNIVDYVSRVDVLSGGGSPDLEFMYHDVRIGMFGHVHTALGEVLVDATNGVLTISRFSEDLEDVRGVHVEFDAAVDADIRLRPVMLAVANTNEVQEQVHVRVTGFQQHYGEEMFIMDAALQNTNGTLWLSAQRPLLEGDYQRVTIVSNGSIMGSASFTDPVSVAISGAPRLVGVRATADTAIRIASLAFRFESNATFALPSGSVSGNTVIIAGSQRTGVLDVRGVAITAFAVPYITLIGEDSTLLIGPRISISQYKGVVQLTWPDPASAFVPQWRWSFSEPWQSWLDDPLYYGSGIGTATTAAAGTNRFFRLISGASNP
jgi:hypothetical protein